MREREKERRKEREGNTRYIFFLTFYLSCYCGTVHGVVFRKINVRAAGSQISLLRYFTILHQNCYPSQSADNIEDSKSLRGVF